MNLNKPLLAVTKSEVVVLMNNFCKDQNSISSGRNFISVSLSDSVKIYVMPATQSCAGAWSEEHCSDCIVFYGYLQSRPFCRVCFDLTTGITGKALLDSVNHKVIQPIISLAPDLDNTTNYIAPTFLKRA